MKFARPKRAPVDVNLTPLIDVVFLLLIFFMVSTTFTRETQLQIELPDSDTAEAAEDRPLDLVLEVSATGDYAINGQQVVNRDLETLIRALREVSAGDTTATVTIRADARSPHQAFVTAMDAVGRSGFANLRIGAQQPTVEASPTP